jgi:uncharacterized membrane protein
MIPGFRKLCVSGPQVKQIVLHYYPFHAVLLFYAFVIEFFISTFGKEHGENNYTLQLYSTYFLFNVMYAAILWRSFTAPESMSGVSAVPERLRHTDLQYRAITLLYMTQPRDCRC